MPFLPLTKNEMTERGWDKPDFVLVTGDAYVDHPSFGTAIISRVLENAGYRVCILSQPQTDADYLRYPTPRLGFLVNGGNIDSMVAHYTAAKKTRSDDAYTAGGKAGARPDRAVIAYCRNLRRLYGDVFIAIGGLEASLRRFAHYDYWDDAVRPSILIDSTANLLMYGMGEKHVVEIANRLAAGESVQTMTDILGTCYALPSKDYQYSSDTPTRECPAFEVVSAPTKEGKIAYAKSCKMQQEEHDAVRGKRVIQRHGSLIFVQNPPMPPLSTEEMDAVYSLPFMRTYHPSYEPLGGVPGIEEVQFSIIHNRGCYGACNFCSLAYHQGRTISCRSHDSVLEEAKKITEMPNFKGYIHDVGGPTANFRAPSCKAQLKRGVCADKKCLAPTLCPAAEVSHEDYLALLKKMRDLPKIKKVFIRSGIRFDYLIADKNEEFFKELVTHHVSGQLKVAPEHCSENVLKQMGKPPVSVYNRFKKRFYELTEEVGKKQYLVPYLMSSHPGSTPMDAIELALFLKKEGMHPEQVQDFYPTPGTVSTCMFYTGLNPYTMEEVYVPRTAKEKAEQRALLQYFRPENREIVRAALLKAGRGDLIGSGKHCLIPAERYIGATGGKNTAQPRLKDKNGKPVIPTRTAAEAAAKRAEKQRFGAKSANRSDKSLTESPQSAERFAKSGRHEKLKSVPTAKGGKPVKSFTKFSAGKPKTKR
ncbi:MAG: YgiQ family radical SAM protein [Clostridia bacterium]|nr:YgiQ family radical SAM protein [Clostridia bacterium]